MSTGRACRLRAIGRYSISCRRSGDMACLHKRLHSLNNGSGSSKPKDISDIDNLPSARDAKRTEFTKWFSEKMDSLQTTLFSAGQALNDVTGYSAIDKLKKSIQDREDVLRSLRKEFRQSKEMYKQAIDKQAGSQREVNELLQRKHAWAPSDLERFTELYRDDHINENAVQTFQKQTDDIELKMEEYQSELSRLISSRYREEQIWSDKIRRASTWGTWGLMGLNVLLFMVVQLGLEPWKRRRLMNLFEERVQQAMLESQKQTREKIEELRQPAPIETAISTVQPETPEYTWENYSQRILIGLAESTAIAARPNELLSTIGMAAVFGAALGTVLTLALR